MRRAAVSSKKDTANADVLPLSTAAAPPRVTYLRRNSLEYIFYASTLILAVLFLGFVDISRLGRKHLAEIQGLLAPPWWVYRLLGSKGLDASDLQIIYLISGLPPALPFLILFLFLSQRLRQHSRSRMVTTISAPVSTYSPASASSLTAVTVEEGGKNGTLLVPNGSSSGGGGSTAHGIQSLLPREMHVYKDLTAVHSLQLVFGGLLTLGISGPRFLFGFALMLFNYFVMAQMYRHFSFRVCMAAMWTFHLGILVLNFHAGGYRFAWFGLSVLDDPWPVLIQWTIHYNMAVLRMIAFNNDLWEAVREGPKQRERTVSKHLRTCIECAQLRAEYQDMPGVAEESMQCYKCRTSCPRDVEEYNLWSYLGYMLYPPLLIAGPICSFNAFVSYLSHPSRNIVGKKLWRYGMRVLFNAVFLMTWLHYVYTMALLFAPVSDASPYAKGPQAVDGQQPIINNNNNNTVTASVAAIDEVLVFVSSTGSPLKKLTVLDQLSFHYKAVLLFLTLSFLWLKFNVIWKFFRFYAMLDGVEPPENMVRCFANTVSIQGFWKDWHASFNLWIVRYMYIPMGGRKRIMLSIFPIFFFIAIWHDVELRLVYWAGLICVCFIPEVAITTYFSTTRNPFILRIKKRELLWRHIRVFATQIGMMQLILLNLIGFAVGMGGAEQGVKGLLSEISWTYRLVMAFFFYCAACIAIQDRDEESHERTVLRLKYGLQSR